MANYGLGRLHAPDPRDHGFLMAAATPAGPLAPYRYYRLGPVLDQGQTSQCVGYSWRGFLMAAPLMTKDGPDAPTIYRGAQQHDEWDGEDYEGSSVRGGAKYLQSLGRLSSYLWAFNLADAEAWVLGNHGCLVVGSNWYEGQFDPDRDGRMRLTGNVAGGHAWLLYGMNHKKGVAWMRNSWSAAWGVKGRAYLAYEDFERLLSEDGECCTAVEITPH